ncbi:MAG TPA: MFS transporter [Candidatus Saccharimonadales bacterium]|nr:MFS transporter [Candidatus Saccharimonadales bacterium]
MSPIIVPTSPSRIPPRLFIALVLLGLSVFINYIDRGNLAIAAPFLQSELSISPSRLGLLLSAFFWTYALSQLISGWLVDRFNVNLVFAAGFALWSVATALTGVVHLFALLFALRLLLGLGESVAYPSYGKILALNFSDEQRGLANSVLGSGLLLGPGFGFLLGGMLIARLGWRPFFLSLGFLSLLWLVPWFIYMPRPAQKLPASSSGSVGVPSLLEFLRLPDAWGTCLGLFANNYVSYFLITWLPYYLVRERNFSIAGMARLTGGAYLLGSLASLVAGWLSDRWIASGASLTVVRKAVTGGGVGLCGVFVGLAGVDHPVYGSVALVLGVIFFGVAASNLWAITQTLAGPAATGRWTGFQNFFGNLAGILAPAVTGFVLQRTGHFYWAFVIVAAVALAGTACWFFLIGPIAPVAWRRA